MAQIFEEALSRLNAPQHGGVVCSDITETSEGIKTSDLELKHFYDCLQSTAHALCIHTKKKKYSSTKFLKLNAA